MINIKNTNAIMFCIIFAVIPTANTKEIMHDNFDRKGQLHASNTSDGKYIWSVYPKKAQDKFLIKNNRMNFNKTSGVMYIKSPNMHLCDFELVFDFTYLSKYYARRLMVNYRIQSGNPASRFSDRKYAGGYVLYIERPGRAILRLRLFKESAGQTKAETEIAKAIVYIGNRWNVTSRISLRIKGNRHQIYVNYAAKPAIDITDEEYVTAGWWNIADSALTKRAIDNLKISMLETLDSGDKKNKKLTSKKRKNTK